MAEQHHDVIVIGGGIAGASVAAELAADRAVALLEAEAQPGYHSTGRSAAVFMPSYGPPVIRALTRASRVFFESPPGDIGHPLLHHRGALFIAREDQRPALKRMAAEQAEVTPVPAPRDAVPLLREDYAAAALHDPHASDLDVAALHQHYLRRLRAAGGTLVSGAPVRALSREARRWQVETPAGTFAAPVVVDAAGAWADVIARLAGVRPLGLVPKRRTAMIVAPPSQPELTAGLERWPLVVDIDEDFYLKPEAGKLLISPADATPTDPGDVQPEELDVAIGVERIERAFALSVRRIERKWAGLRSFLPDGDPAAGFAPDAEGFFWLAGQGGYGIQSSPALARAAAALVRGEALPEDIRAEGVSEEALSPARSSLRVAGAVPAG
jgi:D-arginine dehydrogenase